MLYADDNRGKTKSPDTESSTKKSDSKQETDEGYDVTDGNLVALTDASTEDKMTEMKSSVLEG